MLDELETRYRKSRKKPPPPKTDHKHEYLIIFTMRSIRRFNGTMSERKYKFALPPYCVECGHTVKMSQGMKRNAIEIEVTPEEFVKIQKERAA